MKDLRIICGIEVGWSSLGYRSEKSARSRFLFSNFFQ